MDKKLTVCTKMGADSLAENTQNAPEFICPICLPKPKSSGFQWKKASLGVRSPGSLPSSTNIVVVFLSILWCFDNNLPSFIFLTHEIPRPTLVKVWQVLMDLFLTENDIWPNSYWFPTQEKNRLDSLKNHFS